MAELNYDKLVKLVKSEKDITQGKAAQKLGLSIGQVPMLKFCGAQVAAGVFDKAPATAASVKKLRDGGNRWELIAARTGLGVAAVKAKYEEAGGDVSNSYTGRGRNHSGAASKAKPSSRKPAARGGKPPGRKPAGRKPAGTAANRKGGKAPVVRRTTRRSTAGSNPS